MNRSVNGDGGFGDREHGLKGSSWNGYAAVHAFDEWQAAGAIGNGIVRRGVISATMGTSGVVFAHSDLVQIDPAGRVHTFCHAVRGRRPGCESAATHRRGAQ